MIGTISNSEETIPLLSVCDRRPPLQTAKATWWVNTEVPTNLHKLSGSDDSPSCRRNRRLQADNSGMLRYFLILIVLLLTTSCAAQQPDASTRKRDMRRGIAALENQLDRCRGEYGKLAGFDAAAYASGTTVCATDSVELECLGNRYRLLSDRLRKCQQAGEDARFAGDFRRLKATQADSTYTVVTMPGATHRETFVYQGVRYEALVVAPSEIRNGTLTAEAGLGQHTLYKAGGQQVVLPRPFRMKLQATGRIDRQDTMQLDLAYYLPGGRLEFASATKVYVNGKGPEFAVPVALPLIEKGRIAADILPAITPRRLYGAIGRRMPSGEVVLLHALDSVDIFGVGLVMKDYLGCETAHLSGPLPVMPAASTRLSQSLAAVRRDQSQPTYVQQQYRDSLGRFETMSLVYHGKRFEAIRFDLGSLAGLELQLYWRNDKKRILKTLTELRKTVEADGQTLLFGTNGGMYDQRNHPQGLLVIDQIEQQPVDEKKKGYGNFYLQPNGVFYQQPNGQIAVTTTDAYLAHTKANGTPRFATQSGPMVVVDGRITDPLNPGSTNLATRSGVGMVGQRHLVFLISDEPVNFHTFASVFKDYLGCDNALYLDGNVSRWYSRDGFRKDKDGQFGPMIGVSVPGE